MRDDEKKLRLIYNTLPEDKRLMVIEFAEFLQSRTKVEDKYGGVIPKPRLIRADDDESVVGAIKRLSASYFMLDRAKMLNETSILVTQHVMHERDKAEVIAEMEEVFARHYENLKQEHERGKNA